MNTALYLKYLDRYVTEAVQNSDRTNSGIAEYLGEIKIKGLLTRHKVEKSRAVSDAQKAFYDHRHWPVDLVISHLGLDPDILNQV